MSPRPALMSSNNQSQHHPCTFVMESQYPSHSHSLHASSCPLDGQQPTASPWMGVFLYCFIFQHNFQGVFPFVFAATVQAIKSTYIVRVRFMMSTVLMSGLYFVEHLLALSACNLCLQTLCTKHIFKYKTLTFSVG